MNIVVSAGQNVALFDLTRHLCPPPLIPNWKMSSHNDANMPTIQCHDRQSLADPPVNKTVLEGHGASVQIGVDAPAPAVARGNEVRRRSSLRCVSEDFEDDVVVDDVVVDDVVVSSSSHHCNGVIPGEDGGQSTFHIDKDEGEGEVVDEKENKAKETKRRKLGA